jgi:hypothetical protein
VATTTDALGGTTTFEISAQTSSNPIAVGPEFRVNSTITGSQVAPAISAVQGGGFVVTWMSGDGDRLGIYGQRFAADGSPLDEEFRVNSSIVGSQQYAKVSGLADGGFIVVWEGHQTIGQPAGVYGRRYSSAGQALGAEFQINTNDAGAYGGQPIVKDLSDGGFIVAWEDFDGSDFWGVCKEVFP